MTTHSSTSGRTPRSLETRYVMGLSGGSMVCPRIEIDCTCWFKSVKGERSKVVMAVSLRYVCMYLCVQRWFHEHSLAKELNVVDIQTLHLIGREYVAT